jgi:hypothetical protein
VADTPRIEAWYRDPTWTDALRVSLTVSDLDRLDRQQRAQDTRVDERLDRIESMVSQKLDRIMYGVGGLMCTGLGILLLMVLQR